MTLDFWSLVFGTLFGVIVTVIHYKCGWKNIWDDGGDKHEKANGIVSRK